MADTARAIRELKKELRALGASERAQHEKAYLKSDLQFYGTGVPAMRAVAKRLKHPAPAELARALYEEPIHELRMVAVELLVLHGDDLKQTDIKLVERLIRASKTWALVDTLAINVAGGLVERFPKLNATLDSWARDDDFWIRRSAMLALLKPLARGDGDWDRFARYADAMLEEKEFFIRKAMGWILREVSKKRPGLVYEWVLPRAARASGVTLREASKYLSKNNQHAISKARQRG